MCNRVCCLFSKNLKCATNDLKNLDLNCTIQFGFHNFFKWDVFRIGENIIANPFLYLI